MRANHNTRRKRGAAAAFDDDTPPPPKRHHPEAVEELLETMKFQQQQTEKATHNWVRLNGGEHRLSDANSIFLGVIKSAMYSGSLAAKLVERQDVDDHGDDGEDDEYLDERFREMEESLTNKQNRDLDILRQDLEADAAYMATEAADDVLYTEKFAEAISHAVARDPDIVCDEELTEMKKFVRVQMKLSKDAPETSQDVLREHEAEIGL